MVTLLTSSDGITFDEVDTNYTVTGLSSEILIGPATWSGDGNVAVATFDGYSVSTLNVANIVDEPNFTGLVRTGNGSNDADFEYNSGTSDDADAGIGWIRPAGCKWNYDSTNNRAVADNSGAKVLAQVINDAGASTGLHTLRFKALNDGDAGNTLIVRVYGVNGSFSYNHWSDSFSSGTGVLLNTAVDVADSSITALTQFEQTDIDLGTGYDYLILSVETGGVDDTTETLAIDEFELFAQ